MDVALAGVAPVRARDVRRARDADTVVAFEVRGKPRGEVRRQRARCRRARTRGRRPSPAWRPGCSPRRASARRARRRSRADSRRSASIARGDGVELARVDRADQHARCAAAAPMRGGGGNIRATRPCCVRDHASSACRYARCAALPFGELVDQRAGIVDGVGALACAQRGVDAGEPRVAVDAVHGRARGGRRGSP